MKNVKQIDFSYTDEERQEFEEKRDIFLFDDMLQVFMHHIGMAKLNELLKNGKINKEITVDLFEKITEDIGNEISRILDDYVDDYIERNVKKGWVKRISINNEKSKYFIYSSR